MINSNKIHYKYHKTNTIHKGCFELELSKDAKSSLNPLAFIRIYNEINTLEKSLYSIPSAVQRGVIRYYDCTDGSEEVKINFCNIFPTFKYPYNIQTSITPPPKHNNKLSTYYNWVKSVVPKDEWVVKIANLNFKDFICNRFVEILKLTKNHKVIKTKLKNYYFPYIKAQRHNRYERLIKLNDFINSIDIDEKIFNKLDLSILNRILSFNSYTKFTKDKNA